MDSSDITHLSEPTSIPLMGTKLDNLKGRRKLPPKSTDLPIKETPKQNKTPQKNKLVFENDESKEKSVTKTQPKLESFQYTSEDMEKELSRLVQAEEIELLKKTSSKTKSTGRKLSGVMGENPVGKRGEPSLGSWESFNTTGSVTPPRDEDLPEFDPDKFTPGYVPKTVKKGDEEYAIVVTGVPDTGLCGKYWGEVTSLPSRRRKSTPSAKQFNPSVKDKKASYFNTTSKPTEKNTSMVDTEKSPTLAATPNITKRKNESSVDVEKSSSLEQNKSQIKQMPSGRGRKRKQENIESEDRAQFELIGTETKQSQQFAQLDVKGLEVKLSPELTDEASSLRLMNLKGNSDDAMKTGLQKSASCNTPVEVMVDCYARRDDYRWTNLGKKEEGMAPDAVQYMRVLKPAYHLLSFLRMKGHTSKGLSQSDKNTMVFVVMEGEVLVNINTSQFSAKKGDSFFVPPKNFYNLSNQKESEVELSLIQYQYNGPLLTTAQNQK